MGTSLQDLRKKSGIRPFTALFNLFMASNNYTSRSLLLAAGIQPNQSLVVKLNGWRCGHGIPTSHASVELITSIEKQFPALNGRLATLLKPSSSILYQNAMIYHRPLSHVIKWHLPDDFSTRPEHERHEIMNWISSNVLPCCTEFGKYQSDAAKTKFGLSFPTLPRSIGGHKPKTSKSLRIRHGAINKPNPVAPPHLVKEVEALAKHHTEPLPPRGESRLRQWTHESTKSEVLRFGTVLGALTARPGSPGFGLGVAPENLTVALFLFPAVWDWYLQRNFDRRGFFTLSEQLFLQTVKSLTRKRTGWLRQHPELANRLRPISGVLDIKEIQIAKRNWATTCDKAFEDAHCRRNELTYVVQPHRDTYGNVMAVLSKDSPLKEYLKIGNEMLRHMPSETEDPMGASCAVRNYLLFRLALHLGLRSRNLRQLLYCPPGHLHRTASRLKQLKRGELRWKQDSCMWEVFVPTSAIKNGRNSFFNGRPFQLSLPDLQDLYAWISQYISRDRPRLINGGIDPGTFFVRAYMKGVSAEYDMHSLYQVWRTAILFYGIYNPYTKRGAIEGLLPHGPHVVRDVLATHLLKQTGSYELASYAIQDSLPEVMRRYARFLPHEKLSRAADELNKAYIQ